MRNLCFGMLSAVLAVAVFGTYGRAEDPMLKDTRYYIINAENGRYLDADTATIKKDNTKVQLFGTTTTAKPNQQWRIAKLGDGKYAIINAESGRYLDADTKTLEKDGGTVELFGTTADNKLNRQWRVLKAGPDAYFIVNVQADRLLDADKDTLKKDGGVVQLSGKMRPDAPNTSKWKLVEVK